MDVMWPVRGGPLEIPGGWREMQRKMHGNKIRAAITSEKKKSCKQTAKCE